MAIYYAQSPEGPFGFYITADTPLANIPLPRTLITEPEWKAALALGVELEPDVSGKPVAKVITPTIGEIRASQRAERLYLHDAARATSYGGGTIWSEFKTALASMTAPEQERYGEIVHFKRLMAEVATYFQNVSGLNLTDTEVDDWFTAAMALEAAA